jgi:hypothetical protein
MQEAKRDADRERKGEVAGQAKQPPAEVPDIPQWRLMLHPARDALVEVKRDDQGDKPDDEEERGP